MPTMPQQMTELMQGAMSQAMHQMKGMQPQIVWDCQEISDPLNLPGFLQRQGRVISPQVFAHGEKLYILFGRVSQ